MNCEMVLYQLQSIGTEDELAVNPPMDTVFCPLTLDIPESSKNTVMEAINNVFFIGKFFFYGAKIQIKNDIECLLGGFYYLQRLTMQNEACYFY